jgi:hypothetical protein
MFETTKPGVLLRMRAQPGQGAALARVITDRHHAESDEEIEQRHEDLTTLLAEPPMQVMEQPVASS